MIKETKQFIDLIQADKNGCIQVRRITQILTDKEITSNKFDCNTIAPGDNYDNEDEEVKKICSLVHTPEVVAQYQAQQEANKPQI